MKKAIEWIELIFVNLLIEQSLKHIFWVLWLFYDFRINPLWKEFQSHKGHMFNTSFLEEFKTVRNHKWNMKSRMFVYCSSLWFMKQANFQKKWGRLELGVVRTFFQLWMKNKRCKARHKTFHLKLSHHQEIVFVFLCVEFVRYTTICLYFTAFRVPRYIRVAMWILILD